jgi:UDP-N-acetylglucosamine--N-acetylmuramyl-(pentapeptide) pyrophosphoryl-undecaprenol N-acetylglucosamine transferase
MRLVLTGGGTGGHIYPALEVGRLAQERGFELLYLGSIRGQEGAICQSQGVLFQGFPAEPLGSFKSVAGWKSVASLYRAIGMVKKALQASNPDVVFSTGGYSAAPVVAAAKMLRIPYVLHEANSMPGRANRMFAKGACSVACTFRTMESHFPGAVRTGMPIRKSLRAGAASRSPEGRTVLVVGGSQGSLFLNEAVSEAAHQLKETKFLHSAGRAHAESLQSQVKDLPNYKVVPFFESEAMVDAYQRATVAVARSGGTLAEFAMFGLPSVLVPLPTSADDHQMHNAREFVNLGAARLVPQDEATPERIAAEIEGWLGDSEALKRAANALHDWDVPDATERIVQLIEMAAAR